MTVIQRRVFYGKVGTADRLVEWAREMYGLIAQQDDIIGYRIMTDYQSGRTDRLAVEVEVENFGMMEATLERTMSDPKLREKFVAAFEKLTGLIDHAEVEQWAVQ